MKYWNIQTIVTEYTCPVQMVAEVMGELTAPDIFNAKREDIDELEKFCAIVQHVCKVAKESQIKALKARFRRP